MSAEATRMQDLASEFSKIFQGWPPRTPLAGGATPSRTHLQPSLRPGAGRKRLGVVTQTLVPLNFSAVVAPLPNSPIWTRCMNIPRLWSDVRSFIESFIRSQYNFIVRRRRYLRVRRLTHYPTVSSDVVWDRRSQTKRIGLNLAHCGLGLGLAGLVLCCETRSYHARHRNDLEGHSNFSTTIYSFFILCLEHHYYGDQQWRSLT